MQNGIYELKLKKDLKNDVEIYEFIKKSFPEIDAQPVKDSYFSFIFSFFAHISYPVSLAGLTTVLGKYFGTRSSRTKELRLVNRGALKTYNIVSRDMGARHAYYLTTVGSEILFAFLPSHMCEKTKIRRLGGALPAHDYGIGLSLLQCMLPGVPFRYSRELCFSSNLYKDRGALCVDVVVYFQDADLNTLYIEQDTGTETAAVLVRKLYSYDRFGLTTNKNNHLIISSHSLSDYSPCLSFNVLALSDLVSDMEDRGASSLYAYYVEHEKGMGDRLRSTARALLIRIGLCYALTSDGGRVDADRLFENCELHRDLSLKDWGIEEVKEYIVSLQEGCNRYRMMDYNRYQVKVAQGKLRSMADIILRRISLRQYDMRELRCLLGGFSCFVLPSVLMSNYFDYMFGSRRDDVYNVLSRYFELSGLADYKDYSPMLSFSNYPPLTLRNCFPRRDNGCVCVEYVGTDLGGYIRSYFFRMLQIAGADFDVHLVCIFDTEKEAMDFAALLEYYRSNRKLDANVQISFLLYPEIGANAMLKVPSLLGGGGLITLTPLFAGTDARALESLSLEELMNLT